MGTTPDLFEWLHPSETWAAIQRFGSRLTPDFLNKYIALIILVYIIYIIQAPL